MKKGSYQTGIQDTVLEVIKQSKRMGLKYITKQQIIKEVKRIMPDLKNVDTKVGQALYQLSKKSKYKRQRIKKFHDKEGKKLGWIPVDETGIFDIYHLPR